MASDERLPLFSVCGNVRGRLWVAVDAGQEVASSKCFNPLLVFRREDMEMASLSDLRAVLAALSPEDMRVVAQGPLLDALESAADLEAARNQAEARAEAAEARAEQAEKDLEDLRIRTAHVACCPSKEWPGSPPVNDVIVSHLQELETDRNDLKRELAESHDEYARDERRYQELLRERDGLKANLEASRTRSERLEREREELRAKCARLAAELAKYEDSLRRIAHECQIAQWTMKTFRENVRRLVDKALATPDPQPEKAGDCAGKCDPCGRSCRLQPGHKFAHDCGKDATCHEPRKPEPSRTVCDHGTPENRFCHECKSDKDVKRDRDSQILTVARAAHNAALAVDGPARAAMLALEIELLVAIDDAG